MLLQMEYILPLYSPQPPMVIIYFFPALLGHNLHAVKFTHFFAYRLMNFGNFVQTHNDHRIQGEEIPCS